MRPLLTLSLLALVPLLAGCANDGAGQSASGEGSLAYNGASAGSHSDKVECGASGDLHVNANLGSGSLTVTVKDESGRTLASKSYSMVGQASETSDLSGAAGTWTLSATRGSGFTGQYALHVEC
jgi:hypothetical protein